MLKLLDLYIIRKFISTFFFTVLIFTMISVIIDFSEKVEKFIEEPITLAEILLEYYPSFILYISGLLWPLFTLIAVIFFTSRLAFNSEVISILNAGVSFNRFMRPYLFSAGLLTFPGETPTCCGSFIPISKKTKTKPRSGMSIFLWSPEKKCTLDITAKGIAAPGISGSNPSRGKSSFIC